MPKDENSNRGASWYVMHHLNPQQIEILLQRDSEGLFRQGEDALPPYKFYIPYLYMPTVSSFEKEQSEYDQKGYDPLNDKNALRNDMRCFVFIQASGERVRDIVQSAWNRQGRIHLHYYRDTNRREVTISDAEMHQLIATFEDSHLQFSIDQPLDEFSEGDKVILQMEPWTGKHGHISKIRIRDGRATMTIGVNILGRTKSIKFKDIKVGDVLFEDAGKGRLLCENPIANFEEEIIDILNHQVGSRSDDALSQKDKSRLRRLSTYDKVYVEDAGEQARFLSLQLVCACLSYHKKKRETLMEKAMEQLGGHDVPASVSEAYLMIALFIATRNAKWRTAVKEFHRTHPDGSDIIRRYLSIIKSIKARRPKP